MSPRFCRAPSASSFRTAFIWSISNTGRAANALGLHEGTGSRIAMASTAAGHAYTAALDVDVGDALLAEMEREAPDAAKLIRPRIEANRKFLREHGYVTALGLWSPHINGLSVPVWSPQYQTYVVVTIGLLSAMFDEARLHREVAPRMLELSVAIGGLLDGTEADIFNRVESKPLPVSTHNNKIVKAEDKNELAAGIDDLARRAAFAREMGGADKVKRQRPGPADRSRADRRTRRPGKLSRGRAVSGIAEYDEDGELKDLTPSNCVFGRARSMGGRSSWSATISPCAAGRPTRRSGKAAHRRADGARLPAADLSRHRRVGRRRVGQDDRETRAGQPARRGRGRRITSRRPIWAGCRWSGSDWARSRGSARRGWRPRIIR